MGDLHVPGDVHAEDLGTQVSSFTLSLGSQQEYLLLFFMHPGCSAPTQI